jgi:hypothetical protein
MHSHVAARLGSLLAPVGAELLRRGRERSLRRLLLAMACSALAFFLAAFQVGNRHGGSRLQRLYASTSSPV